MKHAYENKAVISSMKQIFWLHWPYYFCSQTKYISGLAEKSENRSFIILMERSKKFESWLSNIQFTFSNSMDLTYSVCVCVCVCVYSFTVKASSVCKMSETYMKRTDQRSSVVSINLGIWMLLPVSFISVSKNVYFTFKGETPARWQSGEKTIWYIGILRRDDIYWYRIYVGHAQAEKWRKVTKDMEVTLI